MDNQIPIEELLYEEEGTTLDFKREQYFFNSANEYQKSEIIKDILAFANAWRRSDAYILLGVEEVKGGRSRPLGIESELDDAQLQQFVNSKIQRYYVAAAQSFTPSKSYFIWRAFFACSREPLYPPPNRPLGVVMTPGSI